MRKTCRHWLERAPNSCVIVAAQEGERTLHEIGELFGLTRMRICQIEKDIFERIRQSC
jgi:DNA-directed RNA polymerase sigma subunit (sigma70/sigma32)